MAVFVGLQLINAYLVINDYMTIGVMMAITQIFNYIVIPIQAIPQFYGQMRGIKDKIVENDEFLKIKWEDKGSEDFNLHNNIEINGLSYSYEDKKVLSDINIDIKKGQKLQS
ncbi:MAG: hypothetical protein SPI59_05950 [Finegoldia sp.]|nr:hypothetical protein [Finegoldia sp.]